tara:strand:- start:1453 stop:3243 length:1791 start_codon:yes stop_codon:yes gene_type:complete
MSHELHENSNEISQPENISLKLFNHQKKALYYLSKLEEDNTIEHKERWKYPQLDGEINKIIKINTNIGVYADKVGAGKTLTMVSLISLKNKMKNSQLIREITKGGNSHNQNYSMSASILKDETASNNSNLIIVPHSLIKQWEKQFKFYKGVSYAIINKRAHIEQVFKLSKLPEIVLISVTMIKHLPSNYCTRTGNYNPNTIWKYQWNRIIIDEPQTISISCPIPKSNFMWLLCATPKELYSYGRKQYLKWLLPELWHDHSNLSSLIVIRNNDAFVDSSLQLPQYIEKYIKCLTPHIYNNIRDHLTNEALTALRANDISHAISLLNCNTNTETNIVKALISNLSDTAHDLEEDIKHIQSMRRITKEEKESRIKIKMDKLNTINSKIENIKTRVQNSDNDCPICLDTISNPRAITGCCQNSFCFECILMSVNTSRDKRCPMCKTPNCDKSLHIDTDEYINTDKKTINSDTIKSKDNTIIDILKNITSDSRYLIFSEYYASFNTIAYKLRSENISFAMLSGRIETQQKILNEFTSGKIQVLLLNANYFGAGLDLNVTTDIIIYHKFRNDNLKKQVIGRAQRIGRTQPLTISYLQYDDEY